MMVKAVHGEGEVGRAIGGAWVRDSIGPGFWVCALLSGEDGIRALRSRAEWPPLKLFFFKVWRGLYFCSQVKNKLYLRR